MTALVSVLAYVVIIVIGAALRSLRLVPNDLSRSIGFLVLNITLPCAIVTFLNGVTLPMSLLATVLIPIGATWVMIFVAWLLTHRQPDAKTAVPFAVLNMSSFNVGTFGMPFTMGLVSPLGFLVVCLFDVGNSIMCGRHLRLPLPQAGRRPRGDCERLPHARALRAPVDLRRRDRALAP